ncbi:MAG TPA: endopeptidase La [Bacteroidia bacterium]|nr:endopeptidase La [Bacteroidia bacterium]HRS58598.1 endopeptidase La [Bacteroidia bacterium]HRU68035.1 endopeptidase La [Bacteroidia bacterium]
MSAYKKNLDVGFISDENEEFGEILSIFPADENEKIEINLTDPIPVLPLRNTVLFPNTVIPITVSREMSVRLINDAYTSNRKIGVITQKNEDIDNPQPKDLFEEGTIAHIIKKIKLPDGNTMVIIQGLRKMKVLEYVQFEPYLHARVEILPVELLKNDKQFKGLIDSIKDIAIQIVNLSPNLPKEASIAIENIHSPYFMLNFVASNLNIEVKKKQKILEISDLNKKGMLILKYLNEELELLKIKNEIQNKVKTDIDKQQRDYFLHQQLKTITEELGYQTPEKEIEEFKKRAAKKKWPHHVQEVFNKELQKLSRMNPAAADYSVTANYVELLLDLPWQEYDEENNDLKLAEKILNEDHYGLEKVKERILEYLAVLKLKGDMKSPILCLYGPPGVGKTSLGKSIARAMGRKYIRISLGGLHDEAEIRGHRKTYIGAMPGRIIQSVKKAKSSNPVMVLDEIDKIGQDFRGDPASALLEVLDPEQNTNFYDNYLEMEYDLSHVLFVATANNLSTIHPALIDRLEIIDISGYLQDEKIFIAKDYLIPKQRKMHGLKANQFKLSEKSLNYIIDYYTREAGVRALEKKIAKLCRWQAKQILTEEKVKATIREEDVQKVLGPKIFEGDSYPRVHQPGIATGLAWTPAGGDVLFIESTLAPGKGNLNLTGKLGEVMKESALLAYTWLKSNYKKFGLDARVFELWDVHIHVPEGAVPKEGPSAGITLLTSLVSLFTQRPVRKDIAMTGELTLRGMVLPVGGIKEKILAAKSRGFTRIILCSKNKKDVDDINKRYIEGLEFHYVNTAEEVLNLVLEPQPVEHPLEIIHPEWRKD